MTIHLRADELASGDFVLNTLGPPSGVPLGGDMETGTHLAFTSPDGKILSGSWECAPGASRWEFLERGEIITVIAGRMTVEEDGGDADELTAGSTAIFPLGWCGTWTIHERLRKVFVVYRP